MLITLVVLSIFFNILLSIIIYNITKKERIKTRNREIDIKILKILIGYLRKEQEIEINTEELNYNLEVIKFIDDFLLEEICESRFRKWGINCMHGWVIKKIPELNDIYSNNG